MEATNKQGSTTDLSEAQSNRINHLLELGKMGRTPFLRNKEEVESLWGMGALWQVLVSSEDTGGQWSLMEQLIDKGGGPGPHRHVWADEMLYVIDGEITYLLGEEMKSGRRGSVVFVPKNTRHAFRIDSD